MNGVEQANSTRTTNWLYVALAATVVYTAAMWWVIGNQSIVGFFDNPRLNEIGDFLAGMFAPIALIWLVAAVLTQRQELNETREQFNASQKENREQFLAAQDVIKKQMENADKQMDNANKQASINAMHYNLAQESAKRSYRLTLFEKRFQIYNEIIAFRTSHSRLDLDMEHVGAFRDIANKSAFIFSHEIEKWLHGLADRMVEIVEASEGMSLSDDGYGNYHWDVGDLNADQIRALNRLKNELREQLNDGMLLARFWKTMHVSDEDENGHPMDLWG